LVKISYYKIESIAISIPFENSQLLLPSIYRSPHTVINEQEWSTLFSFCKTYPASIILGDYNAHHKEWREVTTLVPQEDTYSTHPKKPPLSV